MKDTSSKPETLRRATAGATICVPPDCIPLLAEARTDKGDALAAARFAGIMAGKRTYEFIPLCHPLPMHQVEVAFDLAEDRVDITAYAQTIAATGVEMEALTAASVAALTLYDMLKPHAGTALEIGAIRLLDKRGGKSHYPRTSEVAAEAAVLVLSDAAAAGKAEDNAGALVAERLADAGLRVAGRESLPDEPDRIAERARHWIEKGVALLVTVGGTGVDSRDNAGAALRPLLDRELPGLLETARAHGQRRTPYAMLSNGVAGMASDSVVVTFPGSQSGASEFLDALLPGLLHAIDIRRRGSRPAHDDD